MIKTVILDFDGTIGDTCSLIVTTMQQTLCALDLPVSTGEDCAATIGIVAAAFSSADSALTALTTSYCIDIAARSDDERLRRRTHAAMCLLFVAFILLFRAFNSESVLDAIYTMCSYTYGPLLGLFAFGMLTKRQPRDNSVPYVAVLSPLICLAADRCVPLLTGYRFGYELLLLNGLLTFAGLLCTSRKASRA